MGWFRSDTEKESTGSCRREDVCSIKKIILLDLFQNLSRFLENIS
jgi:hypothetical protein